jgi:hypothetical protein
MSIKFGEALMMPDRVTMPGTPMPERIRDPERAGQLGQGVDERLGARRRRTALLLDDLAIFVEHHTQALGTTDIDADAARAHDSARTLSSRTGVEDADLCTRLTKPGSGTTRSMMRS